MSVWVGSGGGGEIRPPTTTAALLSTNTSMESGIEAGVVPTVTGSLASARDSLGSLSRAAEPMYDTDHTDLGSELDEAEIRRELMHDKWRLLFDRFDPEGFGEIPWPDFLQTLHHPDFVAQVPPHKLEILLDKARSATSDAITFQEFVNVISIMAKEGAIKYDANTEAFQMRAQWKKAEICRKQWYERWAWLLEERKIAIEEADAIRYKARDALPKPKPKLETTKTLKPVPVTSTGFIGWLAAKPDCQLEIYTSWINKPPVRCPDVWQSKDYFEPNQTVQK